MPAREGEADNVRPTTGWYILRPLVQDIPLAAEGHAAPAKISCIELYNENLYVGTTQAEILHFVSIPSDGADEVSAPQYIFASRLQPSYNAQAAMALQASPGVQQILLLPTVQKACVLCNGTLSFYSLPELSPAFGNTTVPNSTWVGGVDLSSKPEDEKTGVVVMICVKNKVRLVRIRDEARRVRDIEFPGCLISTRRGAFACVADSRSYALLDVENQQKITLFPIASSDENTDGGRVESIVSAAEPSLSSSRPMPSEGGADGKGHGRSTSLGAFVGGLGRRQGSPQSRSQERSTLATPESPLRDPSPSQSHTRNVSTPEASNARSTSPEKPLPAIPPRSDSLRGASLAALQSATLKPHICSPTVAEFLLTTGNAEDEPGVGIFVNLDGDVVRGTLQFDQYPRAVVTDGAGLEAESANHDQDREGFVLAAMYRTKNDDVKVPVIEIQRWDVDDNAGREWMELPQANHEDSSEPTGFGLREIKTSVRVPFAEVGELLRGKRLRLDKSLQKPEGAQKPTSSSSLDEWEVIRTQEEAEFGRRLGGQNCRITLWSGSSIWWILRNPLALKLEATIDQVVAGPLQGQQYAEIDRSRIIQTVNSIRGQEATSETEFLSLEYIRQKASLILIADLLARPSSLPAIQAADMKITEGLFMEGGVDPRVVLSLIPLLRDEVVEGQKGIWIHAGLIPVVERYRKITQKTFQDLATPDTLDLIKRYLNAWRQRKGFGSIADEVEVFQSVDAALLLVLLKQDTPEPSTARKPFPIRAELYALVDHGVDCFPRAVQLIESHFYLFVLSRLYQSRRMARKVLETWRRIIEGEYDAGGGLHDGEAEVRRYLVNIKDTALVDEYGTWLASRNPALGVQVFTNEASRVKYTPQSAILLLRRRAPSAVKFYLEHLVFGKKNYQYANDLISFYLDSVLSALTPSSSSLQNPSAQSILSDSYTAYRALRPPKPTYRAFITENASPLPWWHDRLRLLELIGGSHGSDFAFDVPSILARIEPFEQDLVPESIILDGRQGRHKQALKLLTHGLGDYHTAINYCLLGGASIFYPTTGSAALTPPSHDEQTRLFSYLLTEFLAIEDVSDRLERTSELLDRFGNWYDVHEVLELIPESWSVELLSGFLVSAFRQVVSERNEASVAKALSRAENLQVAAAFVEKCGEMGPQVEGRPEKDAAVS
ncbi:hypothetical protein MMC21_002391 [Puttea exsequens]|nr:hypothetical protein [Puttea exsequens]